MNVRQNAVDASVAATSTDAGDPACIHVSAFVDGELDDADVDRVINALLASDELARFWSDAHRCGDWMRSDEVIGVGDGHSFLRRFSSRLANEPAIIATKRGGRSRSGRFWVRTGLPGASIAAALVVVAWVAMPSGPNDRDKAAVATPTVAIVQVAKPDGAAVRQTEWKPIDADPLSDYVAAHRDVTPFSFRGVPSARQASYSPTPASSASTAP